MVNCRELIYRKLHNYKKDNNGNYICDKFFIDYLKILMKYKDNNIFLVNNITIKEKLNRYISQYKSLKKNICFVKYKKILETLLNLNIRTIIFKKTNTSYFLKSSNIKYNVLSFLHILIVKYIYLETYFEKYVYNNYLYNHKNNYYKHNDFIGEIFYIFVNNKLNYFNNFDYYKEFNYAGDILFNCKYFYYVYSKKIDVTTIIKLDCFVSFILSLIKCTKRNALNDMSSITFIYNINNNNKTSMGPLDISNNFNNFIIKKSLLSINQSFIDSFISNEIVEFITIIPYYIYLYEKYSASISNKFIIIKNKISEIIIASNILNTSEYINLKQKFDEKK